MAINDADKSRLAGEMHNAIAAFAAMCAEDEPGLDGTRFDYRVDVHRADGSGTYPLIFTTDPDTGER